MREDCYIIGGRYGDIIQMLPALKHRSTMYTKPVEVITSLQYADVFTGVSYVRPMTVAGEWHRIVPAAKQTALRTKRNPMVLQWWADEPYLWNTGERTRKAGQHNDPFQASSYGESMYRAMGIGTAFLDKPVFDQRDTARELALQYKVFGPGKRLLTAKKPVLLINLEGKSSPLPAVPEIMEQALRPMRERFEIIDLSPVRASVIFDLLGLLDVAPALITADTATLHLAAASNIHYVAYTLDGWCGSMPRGNCKLQIFYSQAMQRMPELQKLLLEWADKLTFGGGL